MNGYLIPGLLPTRDAIDPRAPWGQAGSRVRGLCNRFFADDGYGFIGYWPAVPQSSVLTASETQPAFFRPASLVDAMMIAKLPSRALVLEFDLVEPAKPGGAPEARRIEIVTAV
jgi:hypothetical protein